MGSARDEAVGTGPQASLAYRKITSTTSQKISRCTEVKSSKVVVLHSGNREVRPLVSVAILNVSGSAFPGCS